MSGPDEAGGSAGSDGDVPVSVPEELEVVPAGPLLGELLDGLPAEGVSGFDTVRLLRAAYRQACRERAVFLQILLETGLRAPGSGGTVQRADAPGEFACEEARAGLVWSRMRAWSTYRFAVEVFVRLPVLGEAMLSGVLDEPRARALVDWTDGLSDAQAGQVCAGLVEVAPSLVVGELIDRIKRACLAIDPDWAERRYRKAVRARKVAGYRNPDGSANLGGYNQPVDRVAAAAARIDALARACKRAGDKRGINLIRSDLYLGMVDGAFEALTDAQIITHVRTHPYTDPGDTDPEPRDDDGKPGGGAGPRDDDGKPGGGAGPRDDDGKPGGGAGPGDDPGGSAGPGGSDGSAAGSSVGDGLADGLAVGRVDGESASAGGGVAAGVRWAVPELRVRLSTLLGRDQAPAQLPGWDFVPAWLARHLVVQMDSAEWRYVVCGPDGHPVAGGLIAARAGVSGGRVRRDRRRGGIVEIAVTADELAGLAADPGGHGRWAPVITGIARAHAATTTPATTTATATAAAAAAAAAAQATAPGTVSAAEARAAGARLRRWVQLRDRSCVHPSCRAPAASTDQDHRIDYAVGGSTSEHNLESACRHDHRVKHDGEWHIEPASGGGVVWVSPLGHRYPSRPPPVIPPLPDPQPDNRHHHQPDGWLHYPRADCDCPDPCDCPEPILPPSPTRIPDPEPEPAAPTYDPDDIPPF